MVKDLFQSNFPLPGKLAEDVFTVERTERRVRAALPRGPRSEAWSEQATSCLPARLAMVEPQASREAGAADAQ